jgi:ATP-dependent exoDNAse (exonuclease V) alpha subunit
MDEAGQLALSASALVLRCLRPASRIVISGDSEQLSPILAAKYPLLKSGPLFGSILDTLMFVSRPRSLKPDETEPSSPILDDASDFSSSQGTIVQLIENFRYVAIVSL